jgi:hypothetical protein
MRAPVAMLVNKVQAGRSAGTEDFRAAWLPVSSSRRCPSLLAQTELNPDTSGRINRQPVAFRRPKVYLFCR